MERSGSFKPLVLLKWGTLTVSEGLVYMRPRSLLGVQARSSHDDDVLHAWSRLNEWVLRKSLAHEVEIGYGLVGNGDGVRYCASIEQPESVTSAEADEPARASLQGGAYLRSRFIGPVEEIPNQLSSMLQSLGAVGNMRLDRDRPMVNVFLDIRNLKAGRDVRSNLLIPVCGTELAKSPSKAA